MSFVRIKKLGNKKNTYKITAIWDKIKRKHRQTVKYLGSVYDKKDNIYVKKNLKIKKHLIFDYGDTY